MSAPAAPIAHRAPGPVADGAALPLLELLVPVTHPTGEQLHQSALRGPFRGFDTLERWTVGGPQEAAATAADLRRRVAAGEYNNRTGVGKKA